MKAPLHEPEVTISNQAFPACQGSTPVESAIMKAMLSSI